MLFFSCKSSSGSPAVCGQREYFTRIEGLHDMRKDMVSGKTGKPLTGHAGVMPPLLPTLPLSLPTTWIHAYQACLSLGQPVLYTSPRRPRCRRVYSDTRPDAPDLQTPAQGGENLSLKRRP